MAETIKTIALADEAIISKIYVVRGKRIMLDRDLAQLYGVETRVLNQAVRRNERRFPDDFMFQLTRAEIENWMSQIVISNKERMGIRKLPLAFTEQGVVQLSSVLNSDTAIEVNIRIIRVFTRMRELLLRMSKTKAGKVPSTPSRTGHRESSGVGRGRWRWFGRRGCRCGS